MANCRRLFNCRSSTKHTHTHTLTHSKYTHTHRLTNCRSFYRHCHRRLCRRRCCSCCRTALLYCTRHWWAILLLAACCRLLNVCMYVHVCAFLPPSPLPFPLFLRLQCFCCGAIEARLTPSSSSLRRCSVCVSLYVYVCVCVFSQTSPLFPLQ